MLLALWLRSAAEDVLKGGLPFVTFIPAVVLTAFCGTVPALLSAIASILLGWYFFLFPAHAFALEWPSSPTTIGFFGVVALDIWLV